MKEKPLFSVAIVSYGQAHLLQRCLESIFAQNCGSMELLICDDHSCDFSEQELRDWIREHAPETLNRVWICQKEHCVGPAAVAQSALEQAQGEFFICCTAAEVFPEPGALLKGSLQMDDDCAALCQLRRNGQSILLPDMAHLQEGQHLKTIFQVKAVLWRTEEFKSVGGYQTRYQYLREEPALLCALAGGMRLQPADQELLSISPWKGPASQPEQLRLDQWERQKERTEVLCKIALPWLQEKCSRRALWAGKLLISRYQAQSETMLGWRAWSIRQKIWWRIYHLPLLWAMGALQYKRRFHFKFWALTAVVSAAGMMVKPRLCPFWPGPKLWACLFLLSSLFACLAFADRMGAAVLRKIIKE